MCIRILPTYRHRRGTNFIEHQRLLLILLLPASSFFVSARGGDVSAKSMSMGFCESARTRTMNTKEGTKEGTLTIRHRVLALNAPGPSNVDVFLGVGSEPRACAEHALPSVLRKRAAAT